MFCFVNINTTKRHPLSRMPFMLPGMSGWRSLNQANRNGRTRTFDTLALRSTALPLSYVPRERQQAFACCLVGFDASRRPYAFGLIHATIISRKYPSLVTHFFIFSSESFFSLSLNHSICISH